MKLLDDARKNWARERHRDQAHSRGARLRTVRRSRASAAHFAAWAARLITWRFGRPQKSSSSGHPPIGIDREPGCRLAGGALIIALWPSFPLVLAGLVLQDHRHVLDYFWTSVNGGRGRQHVHDGTTVEYSYQPGETRHETYGPGQYKVHDLENIGDKEMIFMTIEFLNSANRPLPIPDTVRAAA
jgi:hypothetical protein